ncbi:hypothetical protein ACF0H5_023047 [Mactra antiquata]
MSDNAIFQDVGGEPFPVPIAMATAESLKGYGTIVTDFDSTKVEITPWPLKGWRKLCQDTSTLGRELRDDAFIQWVGNQCIVLGAEYTSGWLPKNVLPSNRTHVLVREANYHPDGGQIFFPRNKDPFIALLALPGDDIKMSDFQAFYFDGSFGVQIHADIWHQPVYPINDEAVILGKQGAVNACVAVDTVDEFGQYLLVPLTKPV